MNEVEPGMRIKTTKLGPTTGMFIVERHLSIRRAGITGTVRWYVPGHGGDVWFVEHDGTGEIGAYCLSELEAAVAKAESAAAGRPQG